MRFPWQSTSKDGVAGAPAFLIVGLGNPGRRYERTRHNIGFMVVDTLAAQLGATRWHDERQAVTCRAGVDEQVVLLAKPQTFMNNSGVAARALGSYYHIPPAAIVVISDDLDLPFGRLRVRPGGSPGGHNGLRSIIAELGTQEFPRVRLGVGRPGTGEAIAWVLAPFEVDEAADLPHIRAEAATAVLEVIRQGVRMAMNTWNGRGDLRDPRNAASSGDNVTTAAASTTDGPHHG